MVKSVNGVIQGRKKCLSRVSVSTLGLLADLMSALKCSLNKMIAMIYVL